MGQKSFLRTGKIRWGDLTSTKVYLDHRWTQKSLLQIILWRDPWHLLCTDSRVGDENCFGTFRVGSTTIENTRIRLFVFFRRSFMNNFMKFSNLLMSTVIQAI